VVTIASSAKVSAITAPRSMPAGRVAHHVVEAHVLELLEHLLDAVLGQRVLVARLRGGEDEQVVAVLVLDQRLVQARLAIDDVDQVVHDATLAAHDEVEVAQADVEVDDRGLEAAQGESRGECRAGGGLADAALAGRYYDDSHGFPLWMRYGWLSRASALRG
jgi:hypothetical protein